MWNAFSRAPQDKNRPLSNPARYRYPSEYSLSLLGKLGHGSTMLAEEAFGKEILDMRVKIRRQNRTEGLDFWEIARHSGLRDIYEVDSFHA